MKNHKSITLIVLTLFSMSNALAGENNCDTQANGDWNDANTWTNCGGTYPQTNDWVSITHAVSFNQSAQVGDFSISGAGDFDVAAGDFTLSTGSSDIDLSGVDVTLLGNLTIQVNNYDIILDVINGDFDLTLNGDLDMIFAGTNSSTTNTSLKSITTDAAGTTIIKGIRNFTLTGDTGSIFKDKIELGTAGNIRGQLSIELTGLGGFTFDDTITSPGNREHSLELTSDTGEYRFNAAVSVGDLSTYGNANSIMNGLQISTSAGEYNTGHMGFDAPVIIAEDMLFEVNSFSGNINFYSFLDDDGDINTGSDVVVNSPEVTTFQRAVGSNNPLASLQTNSDGTTVVYADINIQNDVVFNDPTSCVNDMQISADVIKVLNDLALTNCDLTLDSTNATLSNISGVISGSGKLIKQGIGDLTLSANNSYTGKTQIKEGSMILLDTTNDNPISGSSNIEITSGATLNPLNIASFKLTSGQTLSGTGSISSNLTALNGSSVSPGVGSETGVLSVLETVLESGSKLKTTLNGATPGIEYDQISVTGAIDINGATLTLSAPTLVLGDKYIIIENDDMDAVTGTFNLLAEGDTIISGTRSFTISYMGGDGNDVELTETSCQTVQSGLWSDNNTWSNCDGTTPQTTDDVNVIHAVSLDVDATVQSLSFGASADFDVAASGAGLTLEITATAVNFTPVDIELFGDFTLINTNKSITFGAIDGDFNLVVNSTKQVWFGSNQSPTNGLKSIKTDLGGTTRISNQRTMNLTGDNDTVFNDDVTIGASAKVFINQTGNGNLIFNGSITQFSGSPHEITLSNDIGETQINGTVSVGEFTTNGTSNVVISGGVVSTTRGGANNGNMIFNSPVIVKEDTVFTVTTTNGTGEIFFNNSLNDDADAGTDSDVTINSPNGTYLSSVGNTAPIDSLSTDAAGTSTISGDVTTLTATTFNDAVILVNNLVLSGTIVTMNADVDNDFFDLTFDTSNGDGLTGIDGVLSGSGDFIKEGLGDMSFYSINTMTGNLLLNSGSVINKNASNSSFPGVVEFSLADNTKAYLGGGGSDLDTFELIDGQIIKGEGRCKGILDVKSGAVIAPGFSPGNLSLTGLIMATGATLAIELDGTNSATEYDWISSSITANLDWDSSGGATLDVTLGFTPQIGDQFTILEFGLPIAVSGTFNGLPEGGTLSVNGILFSITYIGGDGYDVVLTALGPSILYVNENIAVTGDGSSWVTAFDNLQDALAIAIKGQEIWVAQGAYYPDVGGTQSDNDRTATFTLIDGVSVYGGFNGAETNLNQQDSDSNITILSGDITQNDANVDSNNIAENTSDIQGSNSYHVINGENVDTTTLLDGFTVTAGDADDFPVVTHGGGIFCDFSTGGPSLNQMTFIGNYAVERGGATFGCANNVTNSQYYNNQSANSGGAVYAKGGTFENVLFDGNQSVGKGGAVSINTDQLTINAAIFRNNMSASDDGGALSASGNTNLENVLFLGNFAGEDPGDNGGGMYVNGTGDSTLTNVTMTGNYAFNSGGGLGFFSSGSIAIQNSIFWNNQDFDGVGSATSSFNSNVSLNSGSSIIQGTNTGGINNNIDTDPMFLLNADPTTAPNSIGNTHLSISSPAIDIGDNTEVSSATDLDGLTRIHNSNVDMGAYEFRSASISVSVTGLGAGSAVLQNNSGDDLTIDSNTIFTFATDVAYSDNYLLTVLSQPTGPNQICTLSNASGTITSTNNITATLNCVTKTYTIGGSLTGLANGNSVEIRSDGGLIVIDFVLNADGNYTSPIALSDGSNYEISVITQPTSPNQTCSVTNPTGTINGANVTNIDIDCNTEPTTMADSYVVNEDNILTVTSVNDVLVNDNDVDSDGLSIVNPGTFTATGIGGSITIASDGTFTYTPLDDTNGMANFAFDVTDGIHTVASSLSITVNVVNDAPTFDIIGDVSYNNLSNNLIQIDNFSDNFIFGPIDEGGQSVQQFNINITSDSAGILNTASMSTSGQLSLDFSFNFGTAIVEISLQDDGGIENGGIDTSNIKTFNVTYTDIVFANGFEDSTSLRVIDYLEALAIPGLDVMDLPYYDFDSNSVFFFDHKLELFDDYDSAEILLRLKLWIKEVLLNQGF